MTGLTKALKMSDHEESENGDESWDSNDDGDDSDGDVGFADYYSFNDEDRD